MTGKLIGVIVWGVFLCLESAFAQPSFQKRSWEKILIPGALCGDGSSYAIFLSRKNPQKVAFDFMGGGACWNDPTCYGPTPMTIHLILPTVLEPDGFLSQDPAMTPVADFTAVYFPYCTGDVFAGAHKANYFIPFYHYGRINIEAAVEYLAANHVIDFSSVQHFTMYGYSAGAIGALFHLPFVDRYIPLDANKSVVADSPGLHFGDHFWDKFSPELINDYRNALLRFGYTLNQTKGNLAPIIKNGCQMYPRWRLGVLQGSRDIIMSQVFGTISPDQHEQLIYGPDGLYELTKYPYDNCSAWVPQTAMHTFLVLDLTSGWLAGIKSARQYSFDIINGVTSPLGTGEVNAGPNYR